MKHFIKYTLSAITLGLSIATFTSALADVSKVNLDGIEGEQHVYCDVGDPTATVNLSTHRILAQGFCPGQGAIALDGQTVRNNYFVVKLDGDHPRDPFFLAKTNSGTIACHIGSGTDRTEYGVGTGFCFIKSPQTK